MEENLPENEWENRETRRADGAGVTQPNTTGSEAFMNAQQKDRDISRIAELPDDTRTPLLVVSDGGSASLVGALLFKDQVVNVATLEEESLPGALNDEDTPPLLANRNTIVNFEPRDSSDALEQTVMQQVGGGFAEHVTHNDRTYRGGGIGGVVEYGRRLISEVPEIQDLLYDRLDVYGQDPEILIHVAGYGGGTGPAHSEDFREKLANGEFVDRGANDPPLTVQVRIIPGPTDGRKPREHPDPDIEDGKVRAHNVVDQLDKDQTAYHAAGEGGDIIIIVDNRMSGLCQLSNERFIEATHLQQLYEETESTGLVDATGKLTNHLPGFRQAGLGEGITYPGTNRGIQMGLVLFITGLLNDPEINVGKVTQVGLDRADSRSDFHGLRIPAFTIQQNWEDTTERFTHARPETIREAAKKLAWYTPLVPLAPYTEEALQGAYCLFVSNELEGGLPSELEADIAAEFARSTGTLTEGDVNVDAVTGLTDERWPTDNGVPDLALFGYLRVDDVVTPYEERWADVLNGGEAR